MPPRMLPVLADAEEDHLLAQMEESDVPAHIGDALHDLAEQYVNARTEEQREAFWETAEQVADETDTHWVFARFVRVFRQRREDSARRAQGLPSRRGLAGPARRGGPQLRPSGGVARTGFRRRSSTVPPRWTGPTYPGHHFAHLPETAGRRYPAVARRGDVFPPRTGWRRDDDSFPPVA